MITLLCPCTDIWAGSQRVMLRSQTEVRKEKTRVKYDEIDATVHELFLIFKKKNVRERENEVKTEENSTVMLGRRGRENLT